MHRHQNSIYQFNHTFYLSSSNPFSNLSSFCIFYRKWLMVPIFNLHILAGIINIIFNSISFPNIHLRANFPIFYHFKLFSNMTACLVLAIFLPSLIFNGFLFFSKQSLYYYNNTQALSLSTSHSIQLENPIGCSFRAVTYSLASWNFFLAFSQFGMS